jgi:hypothetical protein
MLREARVVSCRVGQSRKAAAGYVLDGSACGPVDCMAPPRKHIPGTASLRVRRMAMSFMFVRCMHSGI